MEIASPMNGAWTKMKAAEFSSSIPGPDCGLLLDACPLSAPGLSLSPCIMGKEGNN